MGSGQGAGEVLDLLLSGSPEVWGPAWLTVRCAALAALAAAPLGIPLGVLLGSSRGRSRRALRAVVEAGLAVPTTAIALLCYMLLSRRGWFGPLGMLYTPSAIVLGQALIALPVVVLLTSDAVGALDPRARRTALTLGAGRMRRGAWLALEVRGSMLAAVLSAFGRAAGEIGVALILGGNIRGETRTLTTAIALETSKGEFEKAIALGVLLVALAIAVIFIVRLAVPRKAAG